MLTPGVWKAWWESIQIIVTDFSVTAVLLAAMAGTHLLVNTLFVSMAEMYRQILENLHFWPSAGLVAMFPFFSIRKILALHREDAAAFANAGGTAEASLPSKAIEAKPQEVSAAP